MLNLVRIGAGAVAICSLIGAGDSLAANCFVSTRAVAFGAYDPLSLVPTDGAGNVQISCLSSSATDLVPYTLALSAGSGSYASRTLRGSVGVVIYNIHTSPSYTANTVWGDGSSGSVLVGGTVATRIGIFTSFFGANSHTVYGRIPPNQNVSVGTYTDSLLLTLLY